MTYKISVTFSGWKPT